MAEKAAHVTDPTMPAPKLTLEKHHGQPCLRMSLPGGDTVLVALHGAHVLSWVSHGRERLYLSPKALLDGHSAVRGGVPLCFPQFNQRGPLPKHGFARNLPWIADPALDIVGDAARLSLHLHDSEATRILWPQAFEATLEITLSPGSLQLTLVVRNTDTRPLHFTGALHTYLAVDDVAQVCLDGLQGQSGWDALTDRHGQVEGTLTFNGEFDRVYSAASIPLTLQDGERRLQITQSESLTDTVVWNPGADLCSRLADMPENGHVHMLCVEAARVFTPVEVAAHAAWQGWQRLTVL